MKDAPGDAVGGGGVTEGAGGVFVVTLGATSVTPLGVGGTTGAVAVAAGADVVPGGTLRLGPTKTPRAAAEFDCWKPEDAPGVIRRDDVPAFDGGVIARVSAGELRTWKLLG